MAVRIEDEAAVVAVAVMRARPRRAIVTTSRIQRGFVEGANVVLCRHAESHVHRRLVWLTLVDPEVGLAIFAKAGDIGSTGHGRGNFQEQFIADGFERGY